MQAHTEYNKFFLPAGDVCEKLETLLLSDNTFPYHRGTGGLTQIQKAREIVTHQIGLDLNNM